MASIETSGRGSARAINHDIPLIPFIDFLLCLVMFLLVTAVWSHMVRLEADAQLPGVSEAGGATKPRELQVEVRGERAFRLFWKEGDTVISSRDVVRHAVATASGDVTYPGLAQAVREEWNAHGTHRSPTDRNFDRAVVHTDNSLPFGELAGVMDALQAPEREFTEGASARRVAAFHVAFASR